MFAQRFCLNGLVIRNQVSTVVNDNKLETQMSLASLL
jgi:hypothetical protein